MLSIPNTKLSKDITSHPNPSFSLSHSLTPAATKACMTTKRNGNGNRMFNQVTIPKKEAYVSNSMSMMMIMMGRMTDTLNKNKHVTSLFKAVLVNSFILTLDQMNYDVKGQS